MKTQIQKWGNSLGVRIPRELANKLHITNGTFVSLEVCNHHLIITQEISELDLLLANITDANRHSEISLDDDIIGNESW
jgi:antitoxin MazE